MIKREVMVVGFLFFVLFLGVFISAAPKWKDTSCPINSNTDIAFYGETGFGGVGDLSRSWMVHFLNWWKQQDPSIDYVELNSQDIKSDCDLDSFPNLKLYIQPGGNAYYQQNKLGSEGRANILSLIDSGKAYYGVCAGWFYLANDYYWQGEFYNHADLLDRFPTVEGSILDIADYDGNPGYAVTGIAEGYNMLYYGGPTRGWRDTPNSYPGEKILTYNSLPGNLPAAIKTENLLLTGVHAEAFENDGFQGLTTEDRIENYIWLANSLNSVAGTNFYVPLPQNPPACGDLICQNGEDWQNCPSDCPAPPLPQCSDGVDNDFDNLTDYPNDAGCSDVEDDDETDFVGPSEIFFDGFENGISGWTTTAVSGANRWIASSTNPYESSFGAESKPQSTTDPASVLEKAISTSGFENIHFSYYRRLVGIDAADEFKVKWFDGFSWQILEQTGSNSANDAGYVLKEFTLPISANNNPAFKIRFECTAGAVSEFCRVDNLRITGN